MARISKRIPKPSNDKFNVGLYARLSVENSGYEDSNSIENQLNILRDYVKDKEDFIVVKEYIDNGFTGTNFNRPAFNELMNDIKKKKVNTIIVKDLSRFGRNNIETEEYIGNILPFLRVRFIAVNDMFDTFGNGYGNKALLSSVKNMVNEMYAKDISKKIKASFEVKRRNGDYIGSLVPYGYKKDSENKNKLVIDDEVAHVIQLIFDLRSCGKSYLGIAKRLNDDNILTPFMYRQSKGICKAKSNNKGIWRPETVKFILSNEIYIGSVVQSKTCKNNFGSRQVVDSDSWCVVKDMHEAIIDKEVFNKVQELNKATQIEYDDCFVKKEDSIENPFMGKVVCGVCGEKLLLSREKRKNGKKFYYFYYCRMKKQKLNSCDNSRISYDLVYKIFKRAVKNEIRKLGADIELLKINDDEIMKKTIGDLKSKLSIILEEIEKFKEKSLYLVIELSQDKITEDEFKARFDLYQSELGKLEIESKKVEKEIKNIEKNSEKINDLKFKIKNIEAIILKEESLKDLVNILVDKIVIMPEKKNEILFNHKGVPSELEVVYEGEHSHVYEVI